MSSFFLLERTHQSGLNLRHLADSQMKTPHSSLRVTLPPLHILLCIDMQASSLYRPRLTHHSLPASFLHSIAHLTPVNPFTYPRTSYLSFAPLLSFPSFHFHPSDRIIYLHLRWWKVQPLISARCVPLCLCLIFILWRPQHSTLVPLQPCWISWRCPLAPFTPPPPTHTSPSVPSCAPSRQWCSLLLMLLCKPTLTAT